jgi:hypothetical protein
MIRIISNWFTPARVTQIPDRVAIVWLFLILLCGAVLRFWNLGYASLHGDEDIMALAARGILEHGVPLLPSGMIYPRAPLHTYILAGSISLFGDSEWAVRLPSAIVGSLCGLFAFYLGKRFLEPAFNIIFVAIVTFLPTLIDISQTGRMYVFLVACLLVFGSLIFRWEQDNKPSTLALAFLVWLIAIQFQPLAIFAAPLFLFPGLSNGSWKQFLQGGVAAGVAYFILTKLQQVTSSFYPSDEDRISVEPEAVQRPTELLLSANEWLGAGIAIILALIVLCICTIGSDRRAALLPAVLLICVAVVSSVLVQYHLAGVALLLGLLAWFRVAPGRYTRPFLVIGLVALIAAVQVLLLHDDFPGRKIVGAMAGTPTIWPTMRFAAFSPTAFICYVAVLGYIAFQFMRGRPLPIHVLVFAMVVWLPLLAIGAIRAIPAQRHLLGILPFFLLCLVAGIQFVLSDTRMDRQGLRRHGLATMGSIVLVLILVNPWAVYVTASNDFRVHPDHRGAAEYIRGRDLGPDDVVIAEDSISQTYYLGKVDYRLLAKGPAAKHATVRDGRLHGNFTGTPFIVSGVELEALFDEPRSGRVFIIGSGQGGDRILPRGAGISDVLQSDRLEVVYEGRDGRTVVWRLIR